MATNPIYVDPDAATTSDFIRVDGLCYQNVGSNSATPTIFAGNIEDYETQCEYYQLLNCSDDSGTGIWLAGIPEQHYKHPTHGCCYLDTTMTPNPPQPADDKWVTASSCDDCICGNFTCESCPSSYSVHWDAFDFGVCNSTGGSLPIYKDGCVWSLDPSITGNVGIGCVSGRWRLTFNPTGLCPYYVYFTVDLGSAGLCPVGGTYTVWNSTHTYSVTLTIS